MSSFSAIRHSLCTVAALLGAVALAGCEDGGDYTPCTVGFHCDSRMADVAQKASDVGFVLGVQRLDEAAGGNAELGRAATLEKAGRVSLSLRTTRTSRSTPNVTGLSAEVDGGASSSEFHTNQSGAGTISADLTVGLWRGISMGDWRMGGADAIVSATKFQEFSDNSLHVASDASLGGSLGIRLGIVDESRTRPGISYSYTRRWLPSYSYDSDQFGSPTGSAETIGGSATGLGVRSWRIAASKQLGRIGVTIGYGSDRYQGDFEFHGTILGAGAVLDQGNSYGTMELVRKNLVVGASYRLGLANLVAEFGRQGNANLQGSTFNSFEGYTYSQGRNYFSVGVRIEPPIGH